MIFDILATFYEVFRGVKRAREAYAGFVQSRGLTEYLAICLLNQNERNRITAAFL